MNAQPCRVCRGEPCGSGESCACGRCINCGLPSASPLCPRCQANQQCVCCQRHLPSHSYSNNSNQCNACTKKQQIRHRASIGNIVNEITIPTVRGIQSFDAFVSDNSGVIGAVMDDFQRQYRYVRETSNFLSLSVYRSRIDKVTKFCVRFVCCRSIRVQIRVDTVLAVSYTHLTLPTKRIV